MSTKNAIIIDPGDDAEYIIRILQSNELVPQAILLTHGHFDHTLAALELRLAYNIPVYAHKSDWPILARQQKTVMHYLNFDPGPPVPIDVNIKGNANIKMDNITLEILHTPGHTPGSVCYYSRTSDCVFVGDLVFADGSTGNTEHNYSNRSLLAKSLNQLMQLPPNTLVYPGHGEVFTLFEAKKASHG